MCAHNGTHVDAPFHFIGNGKKIDELSLSSLVGYAYVLTHNGVITECDAENMISLIKESSPRAVKRILVKGKAELSLAAAERLVKEEIYLFGNESQTVGPENAPMEVHKVLLGANVVLLEGIRLSEVEDGEYILFAAPINLAGADGAPCRAVLMKL